MYIKSTIPFLLLASTSTFVLWFFNLPLPVDVPTAAWRFRRDVFDEAENAGVPEYNEQSVEPGLSDQQRPIIFVVLAVIAVMITGILAV